MQLIVLVIDVFDFEKEGRVSLWVLELTSSRESPGRRGSFQATDAMKYHTSEYDELAGCFAAQHRRQRLSWGHAVGLQLQ